MRPIYLEPRRPGPCRTKNESQQLPCPDIDMEEENTQSAQHKNIVAEMVLKSTAVGVDDPGSTKKAHNPSFYNVSKFQVKYQTMKR